MHRRIVQCLMAITVLCAPALAGELDAFVPPQDGATVCWSRLYDAAHLTQHPEQKVSQMGLALTYHGPANDLGEYYQFRLEAQLRDGTRGFATGPCEARNGKMWCGVECDGGGVAVGLRNGGAVLLDLTETGYIRLAESCDAEEADGFELMAGRDDRTFLLGGASAKECKAMIRR